MIWTGVAVLLLKEDHSSRNEGYRGAYAAFACDAKNVGSAVAELRREFDENALELVGFERLIPVDLLERALTSTEEELIEKLKFYPVQFQDIHLHKGDA